MPSEDFHKISVAPMMDWTDRHCRYFLRRLTRNCLLYTEMITTGAILHGDHEKILKFHPEEKPLALQLGGANPKELSACAQIGADSGFCEINLNVGCPSNKVQEGKFGACLMKEPQLVGDCVSAMKNTVDIPITVKTRIGVDQQPAGPALEAFVDIVSQAGCECFIIHARKAILKGLSPKENREIPPLNYPVVFELKKRFPELKIVINGGITDFNLGKSLLAHVDGIMIGRAAYQNCYILSEVDRFFYDEDSQIGDRREVALAMIPYIIQVMKEGVPLIAITRHMLGLFHGVPGARIWRRQLSENARKRNASFSIIEETINMLSRLNN